MGFVLAINPKLIDSSKEKEVYEKLSKIVKIDESNYFEKIAKKTDPYEEIGEHLTSKIAQKITELKLTGVNVYKERWRFYPGNSLASNVIGFIGFQGDELVGRYGIESYYENILTRKDKNVYVNFFAEIFSDVSATLGDDNQKEKGMWLQQ